MFLIKADYFYCKSTKNEGMNFNTRGGVNTIPREPLSPLNLTPTNQPPQGIKVQSPSQMKQPLQNTIHKSQNNLPICHAVIPKFSKKHGEKLWNFHNFLVLVKSSVGNRKNTVIEVSNDLNREWMGKTEKDL